MGAGGGPLKFWLRRLFMLVLTLFFVTIITFVAFQIIPGDPAQLMLGTEADPQAVETLRHQLGYDQPLLQRYGSWIFQLLQGDLGSSIRFQQSVSSLISARFSVTLTIAFIAMVVAPLVAFPLGMLAARYSRRWPDYIISMVNQVGMAIPSFWLGMVVILLFSVVFQWFVPLHFVPWSEDPWLAIRSLILPALIVAIPPTAVLTKMIRATMLEQLRSDYVVTGLSKGLSHWMVMVAHVLRNAMLPVITVMGMSMAELLAGSIVVEQVFGLPGVGRLLLSSIGYRDLPVVQGMVVIFTTLVILVNFMVDLLYHRLDPRVHVGE